MAAITGNAAAGFRMPEKAEGEQFPVRIMLADGESHRKQYEEDVDQQICDFFKHLFSILQNKNKLII
jgi:hypothetical protein